MHFRFRKPTYIKTYKDGHFAQLADLTGDGYQDLIVFSIPTMVYEINKTPFKNITNKFGFPNIIWVQDGAIEDFDGDTQLDMFLASRHQWSPDIIQSTPFEIKGSLNGAKKHHIYTIEFKTDNDLSFELYPEWLGMSQIFIGTDRHHPKSKSFTLSPQDSNIFGSTPPETTDERGVYIYYNPDSSTWVLHNTNYTADFIIRSTTPIYNLKAIGFKPFKGEHPDHLLVRQGKVFQRKPLSGEVNAPTSCHSVAAGDYDNDMDMDLYLVCTGPVENLPNRLYENDGHGNFQLVPNAGGAAGSTLGRGDVVVTADYDHDGFLDLFVANGADPASIFSNGPYQLFRNLGNQNHWLQIDLEGVVSNRDGIGATLELETGGTIQVRSQGGGMHRFSQNHSRIHFGLGSHQRVERLTVRWPSGIVQHLYDLDADQILKVKETKEISTANIN